MQNIKGWFLPDIDTHFKTSVDNYPNTNYQQKTIDVALSFVKNFNLCIDIGANIGLHSVRFSKLFNNVLSFEPVKKNYECLEKNISTLSNVKIYNKAIGQCEENLEIKIPANTSNCGAYSFVDFHNYDQELIKETVNVVPLDLFELIPDLIKIDTQGFEEQVLLGSLSTLKKHNPVIIIELESKIQKNAVSSFLQELNYISVENIRKDYIWVKSNAI